MGQEYTVSDLLASKKLPGLDLIAGKDAASNRIGNVNTIDNIDSYDWLQAGDFLLTTGYIYKDTPEALIGMIERLVQINCSGLGFKTRRYFNKLPEAVIRRANELQFPIVDIPLQYSLADIANEITAALHTGEKSSLSQYLEIHNAFNECAVNGGNSLELIETLWNCIRMPVVLVDSRWHTLAFCDRERVLSPLQAPQISFEREFMDSVSGHQVGHTKFITRTHTQDGKDFVVRIAQLGDASTIYGYVLIFETERKMDWLDYVALEEATIPLILEQVKAKQISEVKHQLRQDFFDDLLSGKIVSISAASNLAGIHNMDIQKTYLCMVTRLRDQQSREKDSEKRRNSFHSTKEEIIIMIDRLAMRHGLSVVSIHRSDLIISFVHVIEEKRRMHTWDILFGFPEELEQKIKENYSLDVSIGVGTPISEFLNIGASYFQANEAIRQGNSTAGSRVFYYENCMADRLLDSIPNAMLLQEFVDTALGSLIDYDKEHGTNLVLTLETYFDCNGNVSTAAKTLFLHRNSLIYRMDRIKEVLNTDLRNPPELLTLQVGLRALKVLRSKSNAQKP